MKTIEKPWGKEEWLILNDKYCLKKLYVSAGERLSLQYHEKKKETMFLELGQCRLLLNDEHITMIHDEPYTINPKDIHRVEALTDCIILEVSTPEVDDVVRLEDDYVRI
jgi:mannose-6-phosphate isomerase-like protein (cupin superfamily)